ncbi:hypothetical protein ILYODFUR_038845 [Ilyodon furcidens]|uniref:Uncharacterized protein n=1 Tax=Ilyodon furcidens TaxID=33524 RepID=A0ABV0SSY0_9TELE
MMLRGCVVLAGMGQVRPQLLSFVYMQPNVCGGKVSARITTNALFLGWHTLVAASCYGVVFFFFIYGTGKLVRVETHGGGSPSSQTRTLNMQPEMQWTGLDQSIFMC